MLELNSAIIPFVFCLFSWVCFSPFFFSCIFIGYLNIYFYNSLFMFLSISLCIVFLVLALDITIYIRNLSQPTGITVLPLQAKCKNLISIYVSLSFPLLKYNCQIFSLDTLGTISEGVIIFVFNIKYILRNSFFFFLNAYPFWSSFLF